MGPGSNLAAEDHPGGPRERWHGRGHDQGQEYAGTRAFVGLAPAPASHTHTLTSWCGGARGFLLVRLLKFICHSQNAIFPYAWSRYSSVLTCHELG